MAYGHYDDFQEPKLHYLAYEVDLVGAGPDVRPPADVTVELGGFRCTFADGLMTAVPIERMTSWDEAEAQLEPFLASWEAYSELTAKGRLTFTLRHFAIGDLAKTPSGPTESVASLSDWIEYVPAPDPPTEFSPPPPNNWLATPLLLRLIHGWRDVADWRASPLVEGYLLLSAIEKEYGGRSNAANALRIDHDVVMMLGEISATEDLALGRKFNKSQRRHAWKPRRTSTGPVTAEERRWVFRLMQLVMLRMGDPSHAWDELTMLDLPPLPGKSALP